MTSKHGKLGNSSKKQAGAIAAKGPSRKKVKDSYSSFDEAISALFGDATVSPEAVVDSASSKKLIVQPEHADFDFNWNMDEAKSAYISTQKREPLPAAHISPETVPPTWAVKRCLASMVALYDGFLGSMPVQSGDTADLFRKRIELLVDVKFGHILGRAVVSGMVLRISPMPGRQATLKMKASSLSEFSSALSALTGEIPLHFLGRELGMQVVTLRDVVERPNEVLVSSVLRLTDFLGFELSFDRA